MAPRQKTIFALATAPGRAGVAVIRISGEGADTALATLSSTPMPAYRIAALRVLRDPATSEPIDEALVLRFARGESFTGEDVVEFQCHGSRAVVARLIDILGDIPGMRLAEPGEFTRRAFDCGRLDLVQVEALSDMIAAETEAQRRAALRQYDGALGRACRAISADLTRALALLEATIDFADEDIPSETWRVAADHVAAARRGLASLSAQAHSVERLRAGWRVAIIGAPNAGKSSFLNALARRDVAIASEYAGTTRDCIEVSLDLHGYPVTFIDTAGLRETENAIEREGVSRATAMAESADLRLAVASVDAPLPGILAPLLRAGDLKVWNKMDLAEVPDGYDAAISARSGAGIDNAVAQVVAMLALTDMPDGALWVRARQNEALAEAHMALDRFEDVAGPEAVALDASPELGAEELRTARAALGRITGESGVESLLDVIFGEFCLGK